MQGFSQRSGRFRGWALALAAGVLLGGGCGGDPSEGEDIDSDASEVRRRADVTEALQVGKNHSCAVRPDGTVWCWGSDSNGQLGDGGTNVGKDLPVQVFGDVSAAAVALGERHSCALRSTGTVVCWGAGEVGQLGHGSIPGAQGAPGNSVSGLSDAVAITSGDNHSCALRAAGSIRCWGNNDSGQLGASTRDAYSTTPLTVATITDAVSLKAGANHTCAVRANGNVMCWGKGLGGQLGQGAYSSSQSPVTVVDAAGLTLTNAVAAAGGGEHSCAVLSSGSVVCWGANGSGQLGNGNTSSYNKAQPVSGVASALALDAGTAHTCAVLADGSGRCWGNNAQGQLGNGLNTPVVNSTAVTVSPLTMALGIAAGGQHTCALRADGTARCWGRDDEYQLGNGSDPGSYSPVTVVGLSKILASPKIVGGGQHTCALTWNGEVACWGRNSFGAVGIGTITTSEPSPVILTGIASAQDLAAGHHHTCALSGGGVYCWGANWNGQLGDGTTTNRNTPPSVPALTDVVSITAQAEHTCALKANGNVYCWGSNGSGQLGNGTTTGQLTPTLVLSAAATPLTNVAAIDAGWGHVCAAMSNGQIRCWGSNAYGQLGTGNTTDQHYASVVVSGVANAASIAAGHRHTCALRSTGQAACWGENMSGQLGNGTNNWSTTPVDLSGNPNFTQLDTQFDFSCGLRAGGAISCWGADNIGQLGNGTPNSNSNVPVTVSGFTFGLSIAAGDQHACALRNSSITTYATRCWGSNQYGQLGNGTTTSSSVPVLTINYNL